MLCRKSVVAYSVNLTKPLRTCGRNAELFNVKSVGTSVLSVRFLGLNGGPLGNLSHMLLQRT